MKSVHTALAAAVAALSVAGGAAFAADAPAGSKTDKADKTQVVPARDDMKPGAAPSVPRMDDNAQRAHDPDRAAKSKDKGKGAAASGETTATGGKAGRATSSADVRDWSKIDKNNDHLISPEEMEEALKEPGPGAKKS